MNLGNLQRLQRFYHDLTMETVIDMRKFVGRYTDDWPSLRWNHADCMGAAILFMETKKAPFPTIGLVCVYLDISYELSCDLFFIRGKQAAYKGSHWAPCDILRAMPLEEQKRMVLRCLECLEKSNGKIILWIPGVEK